MRSREMSGSRAGEAVRSMLWTEAFRVKTLLVPYHHAEPLPTLGQAYPADDAVVVSKGPAGAMVTRLYQLVADRVAASDEPLAVVSGDCTTSLATVAGLQRRGLTPGVIWLDAHADFHTPRTTRSGYLGGMALAMLVGRAGAALTSAIGLRAIAENVCVLAGARDVEPGEREALEASAVRRLGVEDLATAELPPPPWYVHLDVDVVDPSDLPGLRFPAPDGPGLATVCDALRALAARGAIAALGVACTLTPAALADPAILAPIRRLVAESTAERSR
jgi:arginase